MLSSSAVVLEKLEENNQRLPVGFFKPKNYLNADDLTKSLTSNHAFTVTMDEHTYQLQPQSKNEEIDGILDLGDLYYLKATLPMVKLVDNQTEQMGYSFAPVVGEGGQVTAYELGVIIPDKDNQFQFYSSDEVIRQHFYKNKKYKFEEWQKYVQKEYELTRLSGLKAFDPIFDSQKQCALAPMEYLPGECFFDWLHHHIEDPQFDLIERVKVLLAIAKEHKRLCDLGIIHCDLKLENMRIIKEGGSYRIVVYDFGLSKTKDDNDPRYGGSPDYVAPELITRAVYPSSISDMYSLAIVFSVVLNATLRDNPFGLTFEGLLEDIKNV